MKVRVIPDMTEFDVDDVVSILMGNKPETDVEFEFEGDGQGGRVIEYLDEN